MRLALFFFLIIAATAGASEPTPSTLEDAAQDRTGCVWARSLTESGRLFRYDGKRWEAQEGPFDSPELAAPTKLVAMADGSVACVWRINNKQLAVTRHLGTEPARLHGTCEEPIGPGEKWPMPLADSKNRLWITGPFPRIYCVDDHGVNLAHEITPEELDKPLRVNQEYNEVHAVEDGQGRIWVWSAPTSVYLATLRGVLVLADGRAELKTPTSSLKPDSRVLALARADDQHLWMSVANDGVYRVENDSLVLERLPDPAPKALSYVYDFFVHGGDVYAVERDRYRTSLWRWRDTDWKQLIVDADAHLPAMLPRSWLPINEGLLVQAVQGSLWFVPTRGDPAPLTWRCGFPLEDAHALARFADGTFFALGTRGRIFHGSLDLPPRDRDNPRVARVAGDQRWIVDAAGHPWTVMSASIHTPSEWNGESWVAHQPPAGPDENNPASAWPAPLRADAEGRIWALGVRKRRLHIFDTQKSQWQSFANLGDAYLGLRDRPPHFLSGDPAVSSPQYSGDCQKVAYRDGSMECNYYDGVTWRHFKRPQIDGNTSNDLATGPPWFDHDNRLCVNLRFGTSWRLGDDGKWSEIPFESHFPKDTLSEAHLTSIYPLPPEGCVTNHPESIVLDNQGVCWLTWQRELYKAISGRWVKVFAAGEVQPFLSGRRLAEVYVDAHGNALAATVTENGLETFIIRPKSAPPRTTVTIASTGADSIKASLHVVAASPVEMRWRLDEAAWQISRDDALTFRNLSNGTHRLVVLAVDADLQTETVPVETRFDIHIDPDRQITDLIAGLSDPDYARRKAAADALASQPDRSVPALQKARQTAEDDRRWWIDAVLQQISTAKRNANH